MNALSLLRETPTYTDHNVPYEVSIGDDFVGYMRINRDIPDEIDTSDEGWWHILDPEEQPPSYIQPLLERYSAPDLALDIERVESAPLINEEASDSYLSCLDEHGESYLVRRGQNSVSEVIGEAILRGDIRDEWQTELEEIQYISPGEQMAGELVFPIPPPQINQALVDEVQDPSSPTNLR